MTGGTNVSLPTRRKINLEIHAVETARYAETARNSRQRSSPIKLSVSVCTTQLELPGYAFNRFWLEILGFEGLFSAFFIGVKILKDSSTPAK